MHKVRLTPFWDRYLKSKEIWSKSHSNSSTIDMIVAYGVYKGMGGKKQFSTGDYEFTTEKAKCSFSKVCKKYFELINTFIEYYKSISSTYKKYDKTTFENKKLRRDLRAMCGKRYRQLIDFSGDMTDVERLIKVMASGEVIHIEESESMILKVLEQSYEIAKELG